MSDDGLANHRNELKVAINKALKDSPNITEVIRKIRQDGYEVFLFVEATVGFNRRKGCENEGSVRANSKLVRLKLTDQDTQLLRSYGIRAD